MVLDVGERCALVVKVLDSLGAGISWGQTVPWISLRSAYDEYFLACPTIVRRRAIGKLPSACTRSDATAMLRRRALAWNSSTSLAQVDVRCVGVRRTGSLCMWAGPHVQTRMFIGRRRRAVVA